MKRLAFLFVPLLSFGGVALAEPAEGNQDLYGSVLYDKQVAPSRDVRADEDTMSRPFAYGDSYGSVLHDVGVDPWGAEDSKDLATKRDREIRSEIDDTTGRPQAYGDGYGSILHDVGIDPWGAEE